MARRLASLWIGRSLGWLEHLCLMSMLRQGHEVVLYSYCPVENVPEGVQLADAREIHPVDEIFVHWRNLSPSMQSDLFRYNMIHQTGDVWIDLDMFLLNPIPMERAHLFAKENDNIIGNALLGLPAQSPVTSSLLAHAEEALAAPETERGERIENAFGTGLPAVKLMTAVHVFGPQALTEELERQGLAGEALPSESVYPLTFGHVPLLARGTPEDVEAFLSEETLGVHIWGWRMRKVIATTRPRRLQLSWLAARCADYGVSTADLPVLMTQDAIS